MNIKATPTNQIVGRITKGLIFLVLLTCYDNVRTAFGAAEVFAINCGGADAGWFVADTDFKGGATTVVTGAVATSGLTNPAPQAVYESTRYGNFTYTIPGLTGGATYTVRLHFAEQHWTSAGQREFNVSINGAPVLTDFDIFKAAGGDYRANIQQFSATAGSSGQIVIVFTSVVHNAQVNGIEIQSGGQLISSASTYSSSVTSTSSSSSSGSSGGASITSASAGGTTVTPTGAQQATLNFDYKYASGAFVRNLKGTVSDPRGMWDALAKLQPPVGASGGYGLIGDDYLLGHEPGYGLRQLGALARRYLTIQALHIQQPSGWEQIGVQSGTFDDATKMSDATLGWAFFDLRSKFEADLKQLLGISP
jgi:hypothetical protein